MTRVLPHHELLAVLLANTVLVGIAPGGVNDILARLVGHWLSERLGQPFIIDNRPGAGSNIGTEAVVRAPADGYTLLLCGAFSAINATLYDKLNFNFVRDIAPVAGIVSVSNVVEIHPSVPAKTLPEFIAYAKANPGKINMASSGNGTSPHMGGELFKAMTGVDVVHVPYRGGAPALTDLLGGQVQLYFSGMASSIEYVRTGRLRAFAVTTETRAAGLADRQRVLTGLRGGRSAPAPRRARLPRSLISSTRKSMRASPIRRSKRALPT
jgi:tripartite-type tricarboxylate transporter receptor subunit TctC